jgi:hypothetical protein
MKNKIQYMLGLFGAIIILLALSFVVTSSVYAITVTNPSPNPFNPGSGQTSTISFSVDSTQYVKVQIVNQFTSFNDASKTYSYTNVWDSPDAVTYYKEVVKATVKRIYAVGGQTYSASWDGTADKGTPPSNLCQRGTYYFKVISENSPQYTVYKPVTISQWNSNWLAYIRQARTWLETYPYVAYGANTVSRDNGKGTNCTGFVSTVFREMGYNLYYGNFPADGIDVLTTYTSWGGGPYMQNDGKETNSDPRYYTITKQSNILAWWELTKGYFTHVTIATYKDSNGWYIIHSSIANNEVWEELIPSGYKTTFDKPTVYHWLAIGRGN